ncbi:MAG: cytochrome c oxidase subunit II [Acidobacteria bacterium]|nr:MAG: cytochrome c oxidase subunit II [Acidobacteriota bacterium]REK04591.1 MAG: cytochrome c oxidase subunit II [Acidobacteriota bacterium]
MLEFIDKYLPGFLDNLPLLPPQASTVAGDVDLLTLVWTLISFAVGTLIVVVMIYLAVRYRRRAVNEVGGAEVHAPMVEIVSMLIPFIISMGMFVWGTKVFVDLKRPPADAVEYFAFGKQWMWKFQHPNGLREINNFTIPVDTPIKVTMTSEDVIHSFFIPAFRVKQDVVPGRYTTVWFEATQTGQFRQLCAEYCGSEHSLMGGIVTVLEQDEYQAWLNGEQFERTTTPSSSGEQLFTSLACSTCHLSGDSNRGPALHGLPGSEVQLASGETVIADDAYLRESILEPRAKLRQGYVPLMPTFEGQVSEEQLHDLIAFIKTIEPESSSREGSVQVAESNQTPGVSNAGGGGR